MLRKCSVAEVRNFKNKVTLPKISLIENRHQKFHCFNKTESRGIYAVRLRKKMI